MNVGRLRLVNQHVVRPVFDDPADVVQWLGAVQAQDYAAGLWAVGLRTKHAREADVEGAVARRAIVRTWPMRGTLHFVAAADARWMCRLLTPRVIASARARYRQVELDDKVFAHSARVAEQALVGGRTLRRDAMYKVWNSAGIATDESRGLHILGHLAQTGLLCFGPRDGKQHTVTLLEEWVPTSPALERDIALGTLARRYFTSHGPATVYDFAWWAGLTITDARAGLEDAKSMLENAEVRGRMFWFGRSARIRAGAGAAYLLPAWDEFTVAYRDRSDIVDPRYGHRVNAGGGVLSPVVVVGGEVVGTWRRAIANGAVTVSPNLFKRLTRTEREVVQAASLKYARFLGIGVRPTKGGTAIGRMTAEKA